jgi:putative transposase
VNHKRTYRRYKQERPLFTPEIPRRRVTAALRDDRVAPAGPNEIWSSPAVDVRTIFRGIDAVERLERITAVYGKPKRIRVDQGTEFTSKDVDLWV